MSRMRLLIVSGRTLSRAATATWGRARRWWRMVARSRSARLSLAVRKLRLVRPDVAVVDLDLRISGVPVPPPGASNRSGGEVRTSLMLVLVEEDDRWWITAHHNVLQSAGD
jgi:uncharacterized protein (TIGR02246 family)